MKLLYFSEQKIGKEHRRVTFRRIRHLKLPEKVQVVQPELDLSSDAVELENVVADLDATR